MYNREFLVTLGHNFCGRKCLVFRVHREGERENEVKGLLLSSLHYFRMNVGNVLNYYVNSAIRDLRDFPFMVTQFVTFSFFLRFWICAGG